MSGLVGSGLPASSNWPLSPPMVAHPPSLKVIHTYYNYTTMRYDFDDEYYHYHSFWSEASTPSVVSFRCNQLLSYILFVPSPVYYYGLTRSRWNCYYNFWWSTKEFSAYDSGFDLSVRLFLKRNDAFFVYGMIFAFRLNFVDTIVGTV